MSEYFGYNYPFWTGNNILPEQSDVRLIKNDLLQLLLTSPGERRMRPTYGTNIRKFPFELGDSTSLSILKSNIRQAIGAFEPRVAVKDIITNLDPENNYLSITVLCSLTRDPNVKLSVEFGVSNSTIIASKQRTGI